MKEHLEYSTAEDIDDLIISLYDLTRRMDKLRDELLAAPENDSLAKSQRRSLFRLSDKRDGLLRALNDALSYLRT